MLDSSEPLSQEVKSRVPARPNTYLFCGKGQQAKPVQDTYSAILGLDFTSKERKLLKVKHWKCKNQLYFLEGRAKTNRVHHWVAA